MADYKFDGTTLRSRSGSRVGTIQGDTIRAANGSRAGTIKGDEIRDSSGRRIGKFDGDCVRDETNRSVLKDRDLDRIIDGPGGCSKAAMWLLFVR